VIAAVIGALFVLAGIVNDIKGGIADPKETSQQTR
jgi:hypothetical protein